MRLMTLQHSPSQTSHNFWFSRNEKKKLFYFGLVFAKTIGEFYLDDSNIYFFVLRFYKLLPFSMFRLSANAPLVSRAVCTAIVGCLALCAVLSTAAAIPNGEGFDPEVGTRTWYYSKSTFCPVEDIAAWNCTTCSPFLAGVAHATVLHNTTTRAQGLVAYDSLKNWVVVAFRGTDNDLNWAQDFDFFFENYSAPSAQYTCRGETGAADCQVHRGFHAVYDSLRLQTRAAFAATYAKHRESHPLVMVTGHSLGAAMSMLAMIDLVANYASSFNATFELYNFGEPRVGNPSFAFWVTQSILLPAHKQYRVTHKADPIPRLPPLEFGFYHAPHEVWYDNDLSGYNFTFCNDSATREDLSCSMSQYAFVMADHGLYMGITWGCKLNATA